MTDTGRKPLLTFDAAVDIRPRAWPRTATVFGKNSGRMVQVNPLPYRNWQKELAPILEGLGRFRSMVGEISIDIDLGRDCFRIRAAVLDDHLRAGTTLTGDIDNYAKALLDTLQVAGVIPDDKQVSALAVRFNPTLEAQL